jgi:dTDP-4-dehydrorhamnose 3,5-epimerase
MKLVPTAISDVVIVEPTVFTDERGWFMESFNERRFHEELAKLGSPPPKPFVQDNHSSSKKGVLRGLHFQLPPHAQGKLIRVLAGKIFDIAVDLRRASRSFGRWVGVELSAANRQQIWIPEGFAHGFLALEDHTEVFYKATSYYARDYERAVAWNDESLAIKWPAMSGVPELSVKDASAPPLGLVETF